MEKKKIQIGTVVYLDRGKKPSDIKEKYSEPIYVDWTPELQKRQDKMFEDFAIFLCDELKKYIAAGGDLSNLNTKEGQDHLEAYKQKQIDEQNRKKEIQRIKRKMSDEDIEEFIKWKSKNRNI